MASLGMKSVCFSLFHIGDTAVREVFEETGVKSEFRSLLSIRQQHGSPGAFGKSDMYLICRLQPCSFTINFCQQECLKCEWMDLEKLARIENTTPITRRVARLLLYGHREGFDKIDLSMEEFPAVYTGLFYKLYHRELPESYRDTAGTDWTQTLEWPKDGRGLRLTPGASFLTYMIFMMEICKCTYF